MHSPAFPVDAILPDLAASLAANRSVVLQAPPGSGKTTRVAPYLMDVPWLRGRKILLLEPRRLAARSDARQRRQPLSGGWRDEGRYLVDSRGICGK